MYERSPLALALLNLRKQAGLALLKQAAPARLALLDPAAGWYYRQDRAQPVKH